MTMDKLILVLNK